jgi:hypothetical protein
MKRAIGIDFTDYTVRILREKGFSLLEVPENSSNGFRRFICPLARSVAGLEGFEIHVVEDEVAYLKFAHLDHFYPYVRGTDKAASVATDVATHANSVEAFVEIVDFEGIENPELREALELRKQFQIGALHLRCREFKKFVEAARPQRICKLGDREVALIHLGPSCFDLLVSEG